MSIVITLLALFAALILPNLVTEKAGREARQFFPQARNLLLETKSKAMRDGRTRTIRLDDSGGRLVVERIDADVEESTEERTLAMPEGITASAFRLESEESTSGEWGMRFFADGKARAAGISFTSNDRVYSLTVDANGNVRLIDGALPDQADETWDAGGFEQRV